MALCTKANIKIFLTITDTTKDELIDQLIPGVQSLIEEYCNRIFEQGIVTEYYHGGSPKIIVKRFPVAASPAPIVYEDSNRVWGADTVVPSSDYFIDLDNGIFSFDYNLEKGYGAIKVVYTGGYVVVPQAIRDVCVNMVSRRMRAGSTGDIGVVSKGTPGGVNITFSQDGLLPEDKFILGTFRRGLSV